MTNENSATRIKLKKIKIILQKKKIKKLENKNIKYNYLFLL